MRELTKHMQGLLDPLRYVPQPSKSIYIEDNPLCDENTVNPSTRQPSDMAQIQTTERQPSSTLSTFTPDALSDHLLSRLQAGSQWLTAQHQAWLSEDSAVTNDELFSVALAGWDEMERSLRMAYGYEGCIYGPNQQCSQDAPVQPLSDISQLTSKLDHATQGRPRLSRATEARSAGARSVMPPEADPPSSSHTAPVQCFSSNPHCQTPHSFAE